MTEEKKLVKFTWNEKEIEAEEGSNLLQAALDNDLQVAHYCYHPGLSIAGVCRMCMVVQEGGRGIFPACNATVQAGLKISNEAEEVKEAVEWALQLHLVNHPLDCTICDQAGECGLQDYYMKYGQYNSSMVDEKVHKRKVQDIGKNVMLDGERCILCTRCTRFTEEVTKTHELGILNRGDHAEITVHENLINDYAMNLVDICPVGALTSKDFRFKQRVWFLDEVETTCIGCETGCSVKISQNEKGTYRVKPRFDAEVNGHWICDDGREIYKHVGRGDRVQGLLKNEKNLFMPIELDDLKNNLKNKNLKFIINAGLTNEEYSDFSNALNAGYEISIYELPNQGEEFDGILKRGNKNPNHIGLAETFGKNNLLIDLNTMLSNLSKDDVLFIIIPEIIYDEDHFQTLLSKIEPAGVKIALSANQAHTWLDKFDYLLPIPTFLEKQGTMLNYAGKERKLNTGITYGEIKYQAADYINILGAEL